MLGNPARQHKNAHVTRWIGRAVLILTLIGPPIPSPKADSPGLKADSPSPKTDAGEKSTTGLKLLQLCQGSASDGEWCDAYITGVVEGMFGTRTFPARCFNDRPSLGDIKKVIVDFAVKSSRNGDEYPLRRPAALMIRDILSARYCG